jgi:hypothetical protein
VLKRINYETYLDLGTSSVYDASRVENTHILSGKGTCGNVGLRRCGIRGNITVHDHDCSGKTDKRFLEYNHT